MQIHQLKKESHYRVAHFFTFLDHALNHVNTRFPADLQNALLATYFIPQKLPSLTNELIKIIIIIKIKKMTMACNFPCGCCGRLVEEIRLEFNAMEETCGFIQGALG